MAFIDCTEQIHGQVEHARNTETTHRSEPGILNQVHTLARQQQQWRWYWRRWGGGVAFLWHSRKLSNTTDSHVRSQSTSIRFTSYTERLVCGFLREDLCLEDVFYMHAVLLVLSTGGFHVSTQHLGWPGLQFYNTQGSVKAPWLQDGVLGRVWN